MQRKIIPILILISLCLTTQTWAGEQLHGSRIKPLLQLQTNLADSHGARLPGKIPSQNPENTTATSPLTAGDFNTTADQDIFSLALGASYSFSDWLGVGATYAVPIDEKDITIDETKYSIEAMVTMQF